jgi:hypothetical protein
VENPPPSDPESIGALYAKNRIAIGLLNAWLADESGYDRRVWPIVKAGIEAHRLSERKRFSD